MLRLGIIMTLFGILYLIKPNVFRGGCGKKRPSPNDCLRRNAIPRNVPLTFSYDHDIQQAYYDLTEKNTNHFKIIKQYTLSFEKASSSNDYADKTIDYIFDGRRKKSIEVCKTNYTFESNEGEVPELEIFIIDDNHIILNQGDNMIYLTRD